MNKKVKERKEYYIQFTDEEIADLKFEENQKFSLHLEEGAIKMVPFAKIDLNLSEFSRESLEFLVSESVEKDVSVNEVITNIMEDAVKKHEKGPLV